MDIGTTSMHQDIWLLVSTLMAGGLVQMEFATRIYFLLIQQSIKALRFEELFIVPLRTCRRLIYGFVVRIEK